MRACAQDPHSTQPYVEVVCPIEEALRIDFALHLVAAKPPTSAYVRTYYRDAKCSTPSLHAKLLTYGLLSDV